MRGSPTLAPELIAERQGPRAIVVGSQQPTEVQRLVASINEALGNEGTVSQARFAPKVPAAAIGDLAAQITAGAISTLFVLGGNPAFNAPAELNFTDLLNKVPTVIRHGLYVDETSAASTDASSRRALPRVLG